MVSEASVPPVMSESAIDTAKTRFVVLPVASDKGPTPLVPGIASLPESVSANGGKSRKESSSDNPWVLGVSEVKLFETV